MAPKRAAPRTESVNRQSKGSSTRWALYLCNLSIRILDNKGHQDKQGIDSSRYFKQPSSRLTQEFDQSNRRRNTQPPQTIDLTSSDLSSEISQIDTPRSLDRTSSAASLVEISPPSKRRRLDTEVDYSHNQHQNPGYTRCLNLQCAFRRGKGHVGGSSSDHIFVTDSNQPTTTTDDSHYLPPTAHSSLVNMPANLEDLPSTSKVSTRGGVSTRSHEPSGTSVEPSGSSSATTGHWFRSFTCFASSADDEQTALDLSVESTRSGNAQPGTGSNQPITDATVFSNPAQAELIGEGSSASENITRLVTSLSYSATAASTPQNPSSSSSRNLRHQRGGGSTSTSTRIESSGARRGNQGSSRQSSSRNAPIPSTSSNPGVHIHGASSSSQSQSHHHSIQGSGVNYRIMQLKTVRGDISAQTVLLQEINQALLMGSDDSLAGLAVQELVSGVVDLLSTEDVLSCLPEEEMIEIKNLCCNILAHLMDVIPKAADTVVIAVPLLINIMSCSFVGDILERIINVLEQVSRRNGREVLHYGAVPSVLGIYDFVTVAQHRTILSMVANCFVNVRKEDFDSHITGCLPSLCERLSPMASTEPRCLERVCLCFARLVHAFKSEPEKLRHIASFGLCEHLRHLLAASPPIVSNMRDIANMLATLCTYCPDLAVDILKMGYADTVYSLLTDQKPPELSFQSPTAKCSSAAKGPRSTTLRNSIARTLESRGVDNVSAIINLIRAILPPVRESGLLLNLPTNPASNRGTHSRAPSSTSNVLTALFEEQSTKFENLVANYKPKSGEEKSEEESPANLTVVKAVHLLLPMLLDLYTELNGTSSRLKCIEAIQRIVCNVSPFVLSWVVSPRAVSSMVADMLGNPEFSLIAAGIQLVNIFVTRVPNVFAVYFRKEGVLFHLKRLSTLAEDGEGGSSNVATSSAPTIVQQQPETVVARPSTSGDVQEPTPYHLRTPRSPHFIESIIHDSPEPSHSESYESSETSSSNSTLDMDLSVDVSPTLAGQSPGSLAVEDTGYHDSNLRAWIKTQCQELYDRIQTLVASTPKPETLVSKAAASGKKSARRHHSTLLQGVSAPPRDLVPELEALSLQLRKVDDPAAWIEGLVHLASLLIQQVKSVSDDEAPSPFEIQHSGVFLGPRYTEDFDLPRIVESPRMLSLTKSALLSIKQKPDVHDLAFPMMINCLLDCLHQQEHFQVLMNPASQASTEVYAEEMIMAMRQTAPPLPTPPSQRRSGGRRTHADPEEDPNPTLRPVMSRRLAGMAPGYIKLELIRQMDESSTATTSKKSPPDPPSPIWERASPVTSLQVSSLLTAQRLRNQLIQRIMINSVMQSPEGGISRDLLLDPEEGLLTSFSIPSSFMHRRRGGAGGGGRRTTQERSDVPSVRSGVRPEILSMERELLSSRSRDLEALELFGTEEELRLQQRSNFPPVPSVRSELADFALFESAIELVLASHLTANLMLLLASTAE
ncbi:unnamed protein product [Hymenolepis diminuta]|uniref:E3 ubiquitin-protein ligase n=1 Tax=Hymenolepis diminuta TaxID=6216 RepID=A0A158QGC9_HYMDI|nr:unnamed protein product [Hymenolepis diminuta]